MLRFISQTTEKWIFLLWLFPPIISMSHSLKAILRTALKRRRALCPTGLTGFTGPSALTGPSELSDPTSPAFCP